MAGLAVVVRSPHRGFAPDVTTHSGIVAPMLRTGAGGGPDPRGPGPTAGRRERVRGGSLHHFDPTGCAAGTGTASVAA